MLRVSTTAQPSSSAISTRQCTDFSVRPESSVTITGFFAPANRFASSSMPFGSAVAPGAKPRSPEHPLIILSNRCSIGSDTKVGPLRRRHGEADRRAGSSPAKSLCC